MNSSNPPETQPARTSRLRPFLLPLIVLPTVALVLSGVMSWAAVGFGPALPARWGRGFITCLLVLPLVLACLGALEALVDRAMPAAGAIARKLVLSLLSACAIETVLALAVTAMNTPFDASFAPAWWTAFRSAFPAGLAISVFMCFYMKPKMDRAMQAARVAQA